MSFRKKKAKFTPLVPLNWDDQTTSSDGGEEVSRVEEKRKRKCPTSSHLLPHSLSTSIETLPVIEVTSTNQSGQDIHSSKSKKKREAYSKQSKQSSFYDKAEKTIKKLNRHGATSSTTSKPKTEQHKKGVEIIAIADDNNINQNKSKVEDQHTLIELDTSLPITNDDNLSNSHKSGFWSWFKQKLTWPIPSTTTDMDSSISMGNTNPSNDDNTKTKKNDMNDLRKSHLLWKKCCRCFKFPRIRTCIKMTNWLYCHPYMRVSCIVLLLLLNTLMFFVDPQTYSNVPVSIPIFGPVFNFIFRGYPSFDFNPRWLAFKLTLLFMFPLIGILIGEFIIRRFVLQSVLNLRGFKQYKGILMCALMATNMSLVMAGRVYNTGLLYRDSPSLSFLYSESKEDHIRSTTLNVANLTMNANDIYDDQNGDGWCDNSSTNVHQITSERWQHIENDLKHTFVHSVLPIANSTFSVIAFYLTFLADCYALFGILDGILQDRSNYTSCWPTIKHKWWPKVRIILFWIYVVICFGSVFFHVNYVVIHGGGHLYWQGTFEQPLSSKSMQNDTSETVRTTQANVLGTICLDDEQFNSKQCEIEHIIMTFVCGFNKTYERGYLWKDKNDIGNNDILNNSTQSDLFKSVVKSNSRSNNDMVSWFVNYIDISPNTLKTNGLLSSDEFNLNNTLEDLFLFFSEPQLNEICQDISGVFNQQLSKVSLIHLNQNTIEGEDHRNNIRDRLRQNDFNEILSDMYTKQDAKQPLEQQFQFEHINSIDDVDSYITSFLKSHVTWFPSRGLWSLTEVGRIELAAIILVLGFIIVSQEISYPHYDYEDEAFREVIQSHGTFKPPSEDKIPGINSSSIDIPTWTDISARLKHIKNWFMRPRCNISFKILNCDRKRRLIEWKNDSIKFPNPFRFICTFFLGLWSYCTSFEIWHWHCKQKKPQPSTHDLNDPYFYGENADMSSSNSNGFSNSDDYDYTDGSYEHNSTKNEIICHMCGVCEPSDDSDNNSVQQKHTPDLFYTNEDSSNNNNIDQYKFANDSSESIGIRSLYGDDLFDVNPRHRETKFKRYEGNYSTEKKTNAPKKHVFITAKWIVVSTLIFVGILDAVNLSSQVLYSPSSFGQVVDSNGYIHPMADVDNVYLPTIDAAFVEYYYSPTVHSKKTQNFRYDILQIMCPSSKKIRPANATRSDQRAWWANFLDLPQLDDVLSYEPNIMATNIAYETFKNSHRSIIVNFDDNSKSNNIHHHSTIDINNPILYPMTIINDKSTDSNKLDNTLNLTANDIFEQVIPNENRLKDPNSLFSPVIWKKHNIAGSIQPKHTNEKIFGSWSGAEHIFHGVQCVCHKVFSLMTMGIYKNLGQDRTGHMANDKNINQKQDCGFIGSNQQNTLNRCYYGDELWSNYDANHTHNAFDRAKMLYDDTKEQLSDLKASMLLDGSDLTRKEMACDKLLRYELKISHNDYINLIRASTLYAYGKTNQTYMLELNTNMAILDIVNQLNWFYTGYQTDEVPNIDMDFRCMSCLPQAYEQRSDIQFNTQSNTNLNYFLISQNDFYYAGSVYFDSKETFNQQNDNDTSHIHANGFYFDYNCVNSRKTFDSNNAMHGNKENEGQQIPILPRLTVKQYECVLTVGKLNLIHLGIGYSEKLSWCILAVLFVLITILRILTDHVYRSLIKWHYKYAQKLDNPNDPKWLLKNKYRTLKQYILNCCLFIHCAKIKKLRPKKSRLHSYEVL